MNLDIPSNWNIVDKMIFSIEHKIKSVSESIHESGASEPDVELMIAAETEHLRAENESLKKREMPIYLLEKEGDIICPKCKSHLPDTDINYCLNCGHRVIRRVVKKQE